MMKMVEIEMTRTNPDFPYGFYTESGALITHAQKILDEYSTPPTQDELSSRLKKLAHLRANMQYLRFHAPFLGILKRIEESLSFKDDEDLAKQIELLTTEANAKRAIFERTRISLASHLLARAFYQNGSHEFIPFLPYSGGYRHSLEQTGSAGLRTYIRLLDVLEGTQYTTSLRVWVRDERSHQTHMIIVEEQPDLQLSEIILHRYGPFTRVIKTHRIRRPVGLVRRRSVRIALATAVVCFTHAQKKPLPTAEYYLAIALLRSFLLPRRRSDPLAFIPTHQEDIRFFDRVFPGLSEALVRRPQYDSILAELKMPTHRFNLAYLYLTTPAPVSWFEENLHAERHQMLADASLLMSFVTPHETKRSEKGETQRAKDFLDYLTRESREESSEK